MNGSEENESPQDIEIIPVKGGSSEQKKFKTPLQEKFEKVEKAARQRSQKPETPKPEVNS